MKKFLSLFIVSSFMSLFPLLSHAQADFALSVGTRINNADTDIAGATVEQKSGLQFGGLAYIPFNDVWWFRTGFLYTERFVDIKTNAATANVKFTYLDVPVTFMYRYTDFAGFFAGPLLSMVQSKAVDVANGNSFTGVAGTILPIQLGVYFKFHPNFGGELVYEHTGSKLSDGITGMRSIGANLLVTFE